MAVAGGVMQPVLAAYSAAARDRASGPRRPTPPSPGRSTRWAPALVEVDARLVRSVDTAEDLARAEADLGLTGC